MKIYQKVRKLEDFCKGIHLRHQIGVLQRGSDATTEEQELERFTLSAAIELTGRRLGNQQNRTQVPINELLVDVESAQKHMYGFATYQEVAYRWGADY